MAGLMGVTAFLSMWINNSAATSIMIPAAIAIIDELQGHQEKSQEKYVTQTNENHRKSRDIVPVDSTGKHVFIIIII
jgi:di/tricarboxylate transporter